MHYAAKIRLLALPGKQYTLSATNIQIHYMLIINILNTKVSGETGN